MNSKIRKGLGRGLSSLIGESKIEPKTNKLLLSDIVPNKFQPRKNFDEENLNDLTNSIKERGVIQPIIVRRSDSNKNNFEIIAGERRWRAAQLAGLAEVPVFVKKVDDRSAMAMALIENIQRDNLNALEEASALNRLVEKFGLTHQQVAKAVGKSRAMISNLIRLLELSGEVKKLLEKGLLEMGHARAILPLKASLQRSVANQVVKKGLSVRETEALVRGLADEKSTHSAKKTRSIDPDVRRLNQKLSNRLGAKVVIRSSKGGKGKIEISYNSLDELEGILKHIK